MARRYGLLLAAAGLGLVWWSIHTGGPALLGLWPALSLLWVAVAYLGAGTGVLGKRADGRLTVTTGVGLAPFRLLSWPAWWLQGRLSSEAPYQRVTSRLFLGRHPAGLALPGQVNLVVDLTAELPSAAHGRRLVVEACLDGTSPRPDQLDRILGLLGDEDVVAYVHCASGHGRSATVAVAVLLADGQVTDAKEAVERLRQTRPGVQLSAEQARAAQAAAGRSPTR